MPVVEAVSKRRSGKEDLAGRRDLEIVACEGSQSESTKLNRLTFVISLFQSGLDKNEMTGHIIVVKPNVREQLLDTGLQVLHERGFNATSVQDITEAASVPKGSFYNHFESKEDLGAEVVSRYLESSNKTQAVLRDPKLSPYARLRKYFEGLVQVAEKKEFCGGCLLGNFGAELSEQSEMIRARVSK